MWLQKIVTLEGAGSLASEKGQYNRSQCSQELFTGFTSFQYQLGWKISGIKTMIVVNLRMALDLREVLICGINCYHQTSVTKGAASDCGCVRGNYLAIVSTV